MNPEDIADMINECLAHGFEPPSSGVRLASMALWWSRGTGVGAHGEWKRPFEFSIFLNLSTFIPSIHLGPIN